MKPISLFVLLTLLISGCKTPASSPPEKSSPKEALQQLLQSHNFNGSFLMQEGGKTILTGAMGLRSFESKDKLNEDHQFYLASISKQITAMACLMLVDQGKLSLDQQLSDFFPELPYKRPISIRNMLNHTSGIPDYYELGIYKKGMKNSDVYQALLNDTSLDFEPGSQYSYSNSAYVLLSMIAAKASNISFKEFVQDQIFGPLGMKNSVVFDETTSTIPLRAIGHTEDGKVKDYHAYTTGGGGIFSNVGDLAIWESALYTEKLIPQSLLQEAYKPAELSNGEISYYGFGWVLDKENPNKVSHTGSLEGFRNLMARNMEKKRLIIFLTNNSNGDLKDLLQKVEEILDTNPGT